MQKIYVFVAIPCRFSFSDLGTMEKWDKIVMPLV